MENSWTVYLEKDLETGDLLLPIPQEILDSQKWQLGDILAIQDNNDGTWSLTKKTG